MAHYPGARHENRAAGLSGVNALRRGGPLHGTSARLSRTRGQDRRHRREIASIRRPPDGRPDPPVVSRAAEETAIGPVTVFGGTGFLGRRIVRALSAAGVPVRVAARHPGRHSGGAADHPGPGRVEPVEVDVQDESAVARALEGAEGAVNAVSLYVETGELTFRKIHVEAAGRVALRAREAGVEALVHLSGLGADPTSASDYIHARALGEEAVRAAFPEATVFRPSAMFGADDAFLNAVVGLVRRMPVIPLFGRGGTRLQTVFVGDVAEAARNALADPEARGRIFELGGPEVMTYRELVEMVMRRMGKRRLLVPVPFAVWRGLTAAAGVLPSPPLTRAQVELMARDNVTGAGMPGLAELGVAPTPLGEVLARDFGLG